MKYNEFRRWLAARGVTFKAGAKHDKVTAPNGQQTILPRHGAKEMPEGTRRAIIKQLGLKD